MSRKREEVINKKRKALFIVNPFSGTRSKSRVADLIKEEISAQYFDYEIEFTQYGGHAIELSKKAAAEGVDFVVAVGGDGTMNEVATSLVHTSSALGIIPLGSGNGLARHLKIPMDIIAALRLVNQQKTKRIDSGTLNGKAFFCTAGVGFDAYIGQCFAQQKTRGFQTYVRTTLLEFFNFQPEVYSLQINGQDLERKAFLISFANAAQYGNNAFIAPQASLQDGMLDVCIMSPFPPAYAFNLGIKLFNRTLHKSPFVEIIRATTIQLKRKSAAPVQIDGEPRLMDADIQVGIRPKSLQVIAP